MVKVLVISQYYPPESATIAPSIARGLAERGHEVKVLTGFPNYPVGKIFDGYKQKWRHYEDDGDVQVLRVPLYPNHSMNPLARVANYASFAVTVALARKFSKEVDAVYVYATQMTPALGPWIWRLTGGAPYLLHIQDLWPDSIIGSSMVEDTRIAKVIDFTISPWLRSVYAQASAVIGIAPTMVQTLIDRGAKPVNTSLVFNWADENTVSENKVVVPPQGGEKKTTTFIFAGNVGDMQDVETIIRAAALLTPAEAQVLIVGEGVQLESAKSLAEELQLTNVEFKGRVPRSAMPEIYARADFSLVTLKDLPVFRGTVPSKFQASLAHGLPLVTTVQGDVRKIVEDEGLGFTADAENPKSLATAMTQAISLSNGEFESLKDKARSVYNKKFSFDSGLSLIESELRRISKN